MTHAVLHLAHSLVRRPRLCVPPPSTLADVLTFLPAEVLYSCSQVSTLWHAVSVRRAMLVQITEGDFGWASETGYPVFLSSFGDLELRLAIAKEGTAAAERRRVQRLGFQKEADGVRSRRGYRSTKFVKAAGCVLARTVSHSCYPSRYDSYNEMAIRKMQELCRERKIEVDLTEYERNLATAERDPDEVVGARYCWRFQSRMANQERDRLRALLEATDADHPPRHPPLGGLTKKVFLRRHRVQVFTKQAESIIEGLAPPNLDDVDTRVLQSWPDEGRMIAEAVDPIVLKKVIQMFQQ